jgi:hypothetical protein
MPQSNKEKLKEIDNIYKQLNNIRTQNILWTKIYIPKDILNTLRTPDEIIERENNTTKSKIFDNLNDLILIINKKFQNIKNIFFDMEKAIDRNSIKIDELFENKNNKIMFSSYSSEFSNDNETGEILSKTISIGENLDHLIINKDSGIEITKHVEDNKNFIKFDLDGSKIKDINFVSDSSVKISWNENLKAYEIEQNDIFRYDSEEPEDIITIQHNLSTRALDIKVFKYDPTDIDLKYPIVPGMEYPSDNQVKIYLTQKELISVIISRI